MSGVGAAGGTGRTILPLHVTRPAFGHAAGVIEVAAEKDRWTLTAPSSTFAQGEQVGRPSSLYLEVTAERRVRVGGDVIDIGRGTVSI
jgi:predicted PhzF superfamily epimerase YddE/YHI9